MGQVAGADLIILEKGLRIEFFKAYKNAPAQWPSIATKANSTSDQEKYGWLGSAPAMREWKDERTPKGLLGHDYTIINNHYEASIGVNRDDLIDDKYGQIKIRISDMGQRAKAHPDELISTLRKAGDTALCYDGQYFYDTDHDEGDSGTLSNKLTGNGTSVSNLKADFREARETFREMKDDRGKPFHTGALDFVVIAPPALEGAFEELLNATVISQTTNVLKGAAKLFIDPHLTDENDWYLDQVGGFIKPFIYQLREDIQFGALEGKSESGFMRNHYVYGVDYRCNVGYALWQNSIKIVN